MLTVYRRHKPECEFYGKSRNARGSRACRNRCPLWVQGSLRGEYIRKSLNLNSWEAASDLIRQWEASGQIGVVKAEIPTVKEAVEKYIADGVARNLNAESVKKIGMPLSGYSSSAPAIANASARRFCCFGTRASASRMRRRSSAGE